MSHCTYRHPRVEFKPTEDFVQFNFKLSGEMSYRVSRCIPESSNHPSLRVWRKPPRARVPGQITGSVHAHVVTIFVRPEFLLGHLLPSGDEVPDILRRLVSAPAHARSDYQLPINGMMMTLTTKLVVNPQKGILRSTYIEALSLQLLCFAVTNLYSLSDQPDEQYSARELQALRSARTMLVEQYSSSPTLRAIAQSVGLSEKALENGFAAVYGESPSTFRLRCCMRYG